VVTPKPPRMEAGEGARLDASLRFGLRLVWRWNSWHARVGL